MSTYRVLTLSEENIFTPDNYSTAKTSYDGVVLRVGYRDPEDGTMHTDSKFATHYNGFENSNCKIGVYWETAASTVEEAKDEADYVYTIIKNLTGVLMPVFIYSKLGKTDNTGRADNLDKETLTSVLVTFANELKSHFYKVGLMAGEDWIYRIVKPDVIIPGSSDDPDSPSYTPRYDYFIDLEQWDNYLWLISPGIVPTFQKYDAWMYTTAALLTGYAGAVSESNFYTNVANWPLQVKYLKDLKVKLSFGDDSLVFNTEEHKPTVEVIDIDTLTLDEHYTVTYENNINVGEATVTITGIPENGYDGTVVKTFEITPRDITEDAILTCGDPNEDLYYNFDNFGVFCDSVKLVEEVDYDLDYSETIIQHLVQFKELVVPDVVIPGSKDDPESPNYEPTYNTRDVFRTDIIAVVYVHGKGNYKGSSSTEFDIREYRYPEIRPDVATLNPQLSEVQYYYSGKANKPSVNIRNEEYLLIEGKDYTLTYADNINVGQGIVVIKGVYDYQGECTKVFDILATDIASATVSCGAPNKRGSYDLENLQVRIDSMELIVPKSDYEYTETIEILDKYVISTLYIVAKNNFTGSVTAQIQTNYIEDPDPEGTDINNVEFALEQTNYVFKENTTFKPKLRLYKLNDSHDLVEGEDYQAVYTNNRNAGMATINVFGIGDFYGSRQINFMIEPKDLGNAHITSGSADADGVYNLSLIEVELDNYKLNRNIDYYLVIDPVQTNFEVKSTVYVYGIGNYTGVAQKVFKSEQIVVNMKHITIKLEAESEEFVYTGEVINPKVLVGFQVPEYIEPPEVIIPGSEWDPESPDYVDPNYYEQTEPIMTEGVDYTISYVKSINHGTYYVTITGIGNYEGIKTVRYKIIPRDITEDAILTCGEPEEDDHGRLVYDINKLKVIIDGKSLIQAVDYQFTADESDTDENGYPNTKVTVVAQDNYTGTKIGFFITDKRSLYPGKVVHLDMVTVYPRYGTIKSNIVKSGTFYLWDDKVINDRIRITNNYLGIKKLGYLTGWIDTSNLLEKIDYELGDEVVVKGLLTQYADGTGNTIAKDNIIMYIVDILDKDQFSHPYGIASTPNRNRIGWATEEMIKWYDDTMILHPDDEDY